MLGNKKLSKSTGIIVNPFWAIDRFECDPLRFFLLHSGGVIDDSSYDNSFVATVYRSKLQNGLGNLLRRVVLGRPWRLPEAVLRAEQRSPFDWAAAGVSDSQAQFAGLRDCMEKDMAALNIRGAMQQAVAATAAADRMMQQTKPWELCRSDDGEIVERGEMVIYLLAELLRMVGILLQPAMPQKMEILLNQLGVDPARRRFQDAVFGADYSYGKPLEEIRSGADFALFPPFTVD